jgi:hypothetical protein
MLGRVSVVAAALTLGTLVTASTAFGSSGAADHLTPPSTQLTLQDAALNAAVIVNGVDDEAFQCQMSFTAATPSDGMTFDLHGRPQFSNCQFSGAAQAQATVTTHGTWTMTAVPKSSDSNMNHVVFAIPKGGMVFTYSALPGCEVKVGGADLVGNLLSGGNGDIEFFNRPHVTSTGCKTKGYIIFGGGVTFQPSVSIAS